MRGQSAASSTPPGDGPPPGPPPEGEALRELLARAEASVPGTVFAAAVEQAPAAIMITDAAGIVQFVNPAFEAVSGWTLAEIVGKRANVLKSGRHDAAFYRELWRTIRRGAVWRGRIVN